MLAEHHQRVPFDRAVTHTFPLREAEEAMQTALGADTAMKVVITPRCLIPAACLSRALRCSVDSPVSDTEAVPCFPFPRSRDLHFGVDVIQLIPPHATIRPWIDPVVDERGHDPRSHVRRALLARA